MQFTTSWPKTHLNKHLNQETDNAGARINTEQKRRLKSLKSTLTRRLTWDSGGKPLGIFHQPLSQFVPPDVRWADENDRSLVICSRIIERHLLVRQYLVHVIVCKCERSFNDTPPVYEAISIKYKRLHLILFDGNEPVALAASSTLPTTRLTALTIDCASSVQWVSSIIIGNVVRRLFLFLLWILLRAQQRAGLL